MNNIFKKEDNKKLWYTAGALSVAILFFVGFLFLNAGMFERSDDQTASVEFSDVNDVDPASEETDDEDVEEEQESSNPSDVSSTLLNGPLFEEPFDFFANSPVPTVAGTTTVADAGDTSDDTTGEKKPRRRSGGGGGSSSNEEVNTGTTTDSGGEEEPVPTDDADTTTPIITLIAPSVSATVSGVISLEASSTDPVVLGQVTSGLKEIQFFVGGVTFGDAATTSPSSVSLDTAFFADGEYTIYASAIDHALNVATTSIVTLTFDNTPDVDPVENPFVKGGVTLTFDDAVISQYLYAAPVLQQFKQKATLYVPTGQIGTEGHMTWADLDSLHMIDVEMGAHTVTHAELPTLSPEEVTQELEQSIEDLEDHGFLGENFASPYGAYDINVLAEVIKNFNSHRTFNHVSLNKWPFNKYLLHVVPVHTSTTVEEIEVHIDAAVENDHWLVLVFHEFAVTVPEENLYEYVWTTEKLETLMEAFEARGIKAKTVKEMLEFGSNMVENGSFEDGLSDSWMVSDADFAEIDMGRNGAYPTPDAALKMTGNDAATHVFGKKIDVDFNTRYGVRFVTNANDLTSGELGFYMDEYDMDDNWISGKWLGQTGTSFTIDESYVYTPTSAEVTQASLQVYLTAGSVGHAYIDGVEMFVE